MNSIYNFQHRLNPYLVSLYSMFKRFKDGNYGNDGKWVPYIPWPTILSILGLRINCLSVFTFDCSVWLLLHRQNHIRLGCIFLLHFQSDIDLFFVFFLLFAFLFIVFIVGILLLNLFLFLLCSILFTFRIHVWLPFEHTRKKAHSNQTEYTLLTAYQWPLNVEQESFAWIKCALAVKTWQAQTAMRKRQKHREPTARQSIAVASAEPSGCARIMRTFLHCIRRIHTVGTVDHHERYTYIWRLRAKPGRRRCR